MFNYQKFKEAIDAIIQNPEWDDEIERNWDILVNTMSEDVESTITFFREKCTAEELIYSSSVFDDVIEKTQNKELLAAMYELIKKYRSEIKEYHIAENMVFAEQALRKGTK